MYNRRSSSFEKIKGLMNKRDSLNWKMLDKEEKELLLFISKWLKRKNRFEIFKNNEKNESNFKSRVSTTECLHSSTTSVNDDTCVRNENEKILIDKTEDLYDSESYNKEELSILNKQKAYFYDINFSLDGKFIGDI